MLSDVELLSYLKKGLLVPYIDHNASEVKDDKGNLRKILSYGLSSYGYDVRLSSEDFYIFQYAKGVCADPKSFNSKVLGKRVSLIDKGYERYFIIPPLTYALGVTLEYFKMPENIAGQIIGKSTYARTGLILNTTVIEPGWKGHLTIEMFNATETNLKVYTNEGIGQVIFTENNPCNHSYSDKNGKYQDQEHKVVFPLMPAFSNRLNIEGMVYREDEDKLSYIGNEDDIA